MSRLQVLAALAAGVTVTAALWAALRPPRRLAGRVRPYAAVARSRLLRSVDPETYLAVTRPTGHLREALAPLGDALAGAADRLLGPRDPDELALRLRQSGLYPGMDAAERLAAYRTRLLSTAGLLAAGLGAVGWQAGRTAGLVVYAAGGLFLGSFMTRGRVDRAVSRQRRRIQAELYTVNQILAMRARAGGGVVDALRHIAGRGTGTVVAEIDEVLHLSRTGTPVVEALRRAATMTAEPEAARFYRSLAVAQERGVDLADTLLALSRDLRVARRDEAVTRAAGRRVAAVIPIVVVLAPIVLLFTAAPLPTLIFGGATP